MEEFEIQWREILISRLSRVLTKLNKDVDSERKTAEERLTDLRALYPTEEEAHEAFGNAYITEDEYLEIVGEYKNVEAPTPTSAARDEVKSMLNRLRKEIRDFKWGMLSDSEKERIRNSNQKYVDSLKKKTKGDFV